MPDSPVIDMTVLTTPIYSDVVYAIDDPDGTPVDCRLELWRLVQAGADLPNATATTGASQAGRSITVGASDAVASTDTAGAAAGGSVSLTTGKATRNTSGNAAGGDLDVTFGDGIGTGRNGILLLRDGTGAVRGVFDPGGEGGYGSSNPGALFVRDLLIHNLSTTTTDVSGRFGGSVCRMGSDWIFGWRSTAGGTESQFDTAWERLAAGVAGSVNFPAWWQQTQGRKFLASAFTDATATLANTTLSVTLKAGRKYSGFVVLYLSTDQAAEGAKLDFNGGTATMTTFNAAVTGNVQGATLGTTVSAALDTDLTATSLSGTGVNALRIDFSCVVNAAGTFIVRLSQNSHTSGTLTAAIGSSLMIEDMP